MSLTAGKEGWPGSARASMAPSVAATAANSTGPQGLSIDGISRRFGEQQALDDVMIDVEPGEFMSIVGPSGCGKSTLLRSIAGLEPVDAGSIRIGGRDVNAMRPSEREVAFVFQSYALYPHMSCRQNLAVPLEMRELGAVGRLPLVHRFSAKVRSTKATISERVERTAGLLQIEALLDRRPAELSGGQRQRVALGRALIREPKLFLLDEPLANLDAALRNTTRAELHALQRRVGATTLFVTHDQAEAMAISDRIAVMFAGRVRQVGTPDELYRHPVDLDVARFLSQPWLNCIDSRVVARELGAAGIPGADKREGVVAFRAEHATIHPAGDDVAPGFEVEITRGEHAGADANLFVRLRSDGTECVVRVPSGRLGDWRAGQPATMRFDLGAAWNFPPIEPASDPATDGGERRSIEVA